jgi:hypothetical protein
MAYDYAPVRTPDEEEEERRRLAVTYPPVSAAQPTAIGFSPGPHEDRSPLKPAPARFGSTATWKQRQTNPEPCTPRRLCASRIPGTPFLACAGPTSKTF